MKVLASDYDGTIKRDGLISDKDRRAIKKFRKAGNKFGIVTGRGHSGFLRELKRMKFSDYDFLVCNNGCVIFDGKTQIGSTYADAALLETLIPYIISVGGLYAAITVDKIHYFAIFGGKSDESEDAPTEEDSFIRVDHLDRLVHFNQVDCNVGSEEAAADFAEQIGIRYGKWLCAYNNGVCVDIVPKGVSKPSGLMKYLKSIGVDKKDVLTVGDNFNDVLMLKEFGGYVMESGHPEVIRKIGRTCRDIAEMVDIISK